MRVLYPFVGDSIGGSHVSALSLIAGLDRDKFDPVILLHQDDMLAEHLSKLGIPFVLRTDVEVINRSSIVGDFYNMLRTCFSVQRTLNQLKIDIVHTNDLRMHMTWGPGARLARCGFVWHQRTADDSRRNALYSKLAQRILTISQYCKSRLPVSMGQRAQVVYNPFEDSVDTSRRPQLREEIIGQCRGAAANAKIVGFVGNLQHQKRPLDFLKAARIISELFDEDVVFPMFGERRADMLPSVEREIANLELDDSVVLMGHTMPISPWIAACDVVVAPGINEGFGRVLVEAMMAKTPVVASNDSGHKEILSNGETGYLAEPENPEAMASDILKVLQDPSGAQAMAQAAYDDARQRFSISTHVREVQDVYEAVSEGRPE